MKESMKRVIAGLTLLAAVTLISACGKGQKVSVPAPTPSCSGLTSDITPGSGRGTPPYGGAGTGPWYTRLMIATSPDGITWTRTNQIISDQADVPDAIIDPNGCVRMYYVDWYNGNIIAVAISPDGLTNWVYKRVNISGISSAGLEGDPVDPDVVLLTDGTYRLYFTSSPPGESARTYSATSTDGVNFSLESGVRFEVSGSQVFDPTLLWVKTQWVYFAGRGGPGNFLATSPDGLSFTKQSDVSLTTGGGGDFRFANGVSTGTGYRFYGFDMGSTTSAIWSAFSTDGLTWKLESGARLTVDTTYGLESNMVKEPAIVMRSDGTWLMFYVTQIP